MGSICSKQDLQQQQRLEEEVKNLKKNNENLQTELENYKTTLKEKSQEAQKNIQTFSDNKQLLQQRENYITQLENQINQLKANVSQQQDNQADIKKEKRDKRNQLKLEEDQKQKQLLSQVDQIMQLENQLKELKTIIQQKDEQILNVQNSSLQVQESLQQKLQVQQKAYEEQYLKYQQEKSTLESNENHDNKNIINFSESPINNIVQQLQEAKDLINSQLTQPETISQQQNQQQQQQQSLSTENITTEPRSLKLNQSEQEELQQIYNESINVLKEGKIVLKYGRDDFLGSPKKRKIMFSDDFTKFSFNNPKSKKFNYKQKADKVFQTIEIQKIVEGLVSNKKLKKVEQENVLSFSLMMRNRTIGLISVDENKGQDQLETLNDYKQCLQTVSSYFKMYEIVNNKFTGFKKLYQSEDEQNRNSSVFSSQSQAQVEEDSDNDDDDDDE